MNQWFLNNSFHQIYYVRCQANGSVVSSFRLKTSDLKIGVALAISQSGGQTPWVKYELNREAKGGATISAHSVRSLVGIPLGPDAAGDFSLEIASNTLAIVMLINANLSSHRLATAGTNALGIINKYGCKIKIQKCRTWMVRRTNWSIWLSKRPNSWLKYGLSRLSGLSRLMNTTGGRLYFGFISRWRCQRRWGGGVFNIDGHVICLSLNFWQVDC